MEALTFLLWQLCIASASIWGFHTVSLLLHHSFTSHSFLSLSPQLPPPPTPFSPPIRLTILVDAVEEDLAGSQLLHGPRQLVRSNGPALAPAAHLRCGAVQRTRGKEAHAGYRGLGFRVQGGMAEGGSVSRVGTQAGTKVATTYYAPSR